MLGLTDVPLRGFRAGVSSGRLIHAGGEPVNGSDGHSLTWSLVSPGSVGAAVVQLLVGILFVLERSLASVRGLPSGQTINPWLLLLTVVSLFEEGHVRPLMKPVEDNDDPRQTAEPHC
ncbi:MAG: hypothetical protein QOH19_1789, partial [Actinomycetota bacterium]|nr:hypothetical protein [Actinomycetota bacterium]